MTKQTIPNIMSEEKVQPIRSRDAVDQALSATKENFASLISNADQKANIIIAITSLIFMISVGQISEMESGYQAALIALMIFSLISLLLAIIAVTPNYRQKKKDINMMSKEQLNLFFFGHFSNLSFNDYYREMSRVFNDDEEMYKSIVKDIYQMGVVLHKEKFKILFWSYRFFFVGLLLSFIITIGQLIIDSL